MDFNIEVRKKQLKSLGQYIKSSKISVEALYKSLGWNSKNLEIENVKLPCPVNKNHLISLKSKEDHIKRCQIQSLGYDLSEKFLSEPHENLTGTIKLDATAKVKILTKARDNSTTATFKAAWNGHDPDPITSDRLTSTFSSDERLALYDHCVKNTQGPRIPEEFTLSLNTEKEGPKVLSLEEQLMQERDAKRKRAKYKSVHTNRKNQTEIMREVIDNQMELLTEWLKEKELLEKEKLEEKAKQENQDPLDTCKSSEQYHYIQVHTTYGDVSIPANVLSEPLPSFNSEESQYIDKPPSPRSQSPQSGKRSSRSAERHSRKWKEDSIRLKNGHFRKERRPSYENEKVVHRSKSRETHRSRSRENVNTHKSDNYYRSEQSSIDSRRNIKAEEATEFVYRDRQTTMDRGRKIRHARRSASRERSKSFENYQRSSEFHHSKLRSPHREKFPVFQENDGIEHTNFRRSPERRSQANRTSDSYHGMRRSTSREREVSAFYPTEVYEDNLEREDRYFYPHREERERTRVPFREGRRPEYEFRREPPLRGRGSRGRFHHFRGRGRGHFKY